jgi:hypothetical protein
MFAKFRQYIYELTSRVQVPAGYSPQVCVVMKGHLVNPSCASSSWGLLLKIMDLRQYNWHVSEHTKAMKINKRVRTHLVPMGD